MNLMLQVHMPLFFLLSGFCMTLGYGKKKYTSSTLCCGNCTCITGCDCKPCRKSSEEGQIFNSANFYLGRMTRIMPVYYFCYFAALPLIYLGYGISPWYDMHFNGIGLIVSLFGVQTWVILYGFGPNGPSWTVSTLFFFYLVYPRYDSVRKPFLYQT